MPSTIDTKGLRAAVALAVRRMNRSPGAPAPKVAATHDQILAVSGMIDAVFRREYQASMLKDVQRHSADGSMVGCITPGAGKLKFLGEGVQGCVWRSQDGKKAFKIGKVGLREEHGLTRKFEEARAEHAISTAAGKAGIGPKTLDFYFCCPDDSQCYYVLVMEFVAGKSLYEWHKTASVVKRADMRKRVLEVVKKLSAAGIEHADLHANNVVVTAAGAPVVLDFGRASWAREERVKDRLSVDRFFSDTDTMADACYYAATLLIKSGAVVVK